LVAAHLADAAERVPFLSNRANAVRATGTKDPDLVDGDLVPLRLDPEVFAAAVPAAERQCLNNRVVVRYLVVDVEVGIRERLVQERHDLDERFTRELASVRSEYQLRVEQRLGVGESTFVESRNESSSQLTRIHGRTVASIAYGIERGRSLCYKPGRRRVA
jgi:hypothetical protein